jgi:hypothetical protein
VQLNGIVSGIVIDYSNTIFNNLIDHIFIICFYNFSMSSDDSRKWKNRKDWENDPATEKQMKKLRHLGENPSNYKDTKGEYSNVIRSAENGDLSGKISNNIRKIKKWGQDDF